MPTSTTTSDEGSYTSIILLRCCAGDSVVVWCVGWAVWDSFKNITAEFSAGLAARIKTSAERLRDESEQRVLGWKLGKVNALKTSRDSTLNYYTSRFFQYLYLQKSYFVSASVYKLISFGFHHHWHLCHILPCSDLKSLWHNKGKD